MYKAVWIVDVSWNTVTVSWFITDYSALHEECSATRWGCCPDGITRARPGRKGCAQNDAIEECVGSEYGCCLDLKTAAFGPYLLGCPNMYTCEVSHLMKWLNRLFPVRSLVQSCIRYLYG